MLPFTTRLLPSEATIWAHSLDAHRALREEFISAFSRHVLNPYDRGPQGLFVRDAVHCPTRLYVEVQKIGATAAVATWETGRVEMTFSNRCGLSSPGERQAVTVLLSRIDEADDRRAITMLRAETAEATCDLHAAVFQELGADARPLAATIVVSSHPVDQLLRACAAALAEAFFRQFGAPGGESEMKATLGAS